MADEFREVPLDDGSIGIIPDCPCSACRKRRDLRGYFFIRACSFCGDEQYCRKISEPLAEVIYSCWPCVRRMEGRANKPVPLLPM